MSTRPVALVAGGSRGLGLLIARELGRRGFHPVLWARDAAELDRAVAALADEGVSATGTVCDVRDHAAVEDRVARVEDELGPVEVAVHVAGVIQVGPLASLTREHFEEAIGIMTWGPINLALAVVPGMRARGRGRFATIASIGGLVSVPHLLPYSTAKFAAVGFTNGLRSELAGSGVTATTVAPGLMRTGSHLRAEFTGDAPAEYAWFAPGASMPLVSMDAERAAARIVRGVLRGRSIVILTPLAKIGARVEGVAPATTAAALGLVARLLPEAPGGPQETVEGHDARRRLTSPLVERLTAWGNRAAARNNEGGA
jgi:NAD(P)-dependent dehydrogenase (short-subunit alcohol dehydrogenase family)